MLEQDVKAVLLFGIPTKKDKDGSGAYAQNGVVQKATNNLKKEFGDEIVVIADVCLCEYTNHGHCGILKNNGVQNDETLTLLQKTAVTQAESGVDIVAPSAMMDGQVNAIRELLMMQVFQKCQSWDIQRSSLQDSMVLFEKPPDQLRNLVTEKHTR